MANYHFFAGAPNPEYRKGVLKAQIDLYRNHSVLLYDQYPLQLSQFKAVMYRKDIEFFLKEVVFPMEPLTDVERNKIGEVKDLYYTVTRSLRIYAYFLGTCTTLYSMFNPRHEWVYKYHLKYIPSIPRRELYKRLAKGAAWGLLTYTSGSWLVPLVRALYLSELLANLQIGEQFELGYWSRAFVTQLTSPPKS